MSNLNSLRLAAAYMTALAIKRAFSEAQLLGGGVNDIGFYYDFILTQSIDSTFIPYLEQQVKTLIKEDYPIRLQEMTRKNALEMFQHFQLSPQVELLENCSLQSVNVVVIDELYDLCDGELPESSSQIGAIKLLNLTSLSHKLHLRIEGVAEENPMRLKQFLKTLENFKKIDHRVIGPELQLFFISEQVSQGLFWLPKGVVLKEKLKELLINFYQKNDYLMVQSPSLIFSDYLKKLRQNNKLQLSLSDLQESLTLNYHLSHAICYKKSFDSLSSNLPICFAEIPEIHQKESQTWGLFRTSIFEGDRATSFCTTQQLGEVLISSLQFIQKFLKILGFEYQCFLPLRGKKTTGIFESWPKLASVLEKAAQDCQINYIVSKDKSCVNGPRLEFILTDSLGREWDGPYLELNIDLPEKLDLQLSGKNIRPIMISWSATTSITRLIGLLIEKKAGRLPEWLAPELVRIIPVNESNVRFAKTILEAFKKNGFRANIDYRIDNLGARVHAAELQKIPYTILIGDTEEKNSFITVRTFTDNVVKKKMKLEDFLSELTKRLSSLNHHNEE